jgi:hypothetical protein
MSDQPPTTEKKDVVFTDVHIREHARRHDGGSAVPEEGYLALGLGWNYEDNAPVPLDEYETQREQEGRQGTRYLDVIVSCRQCFAHADTSSFLFSVL